MNVSKMTYQFKIIINGEVNVRTEILYGYKRGRTEGR